MITDDDAAPQHLAFHLRKAIAAAERLNAVAPNDRALLRLCIHLYDAAEQWEASPHGTLLDPVRQSSGPFVTVTD